MNKNQKVILWIGIAVFLLLGLFPPNTSHFGFGALLFELSDRTISYRKLLVGWTIVAVLTGGLIYTLKDQKYKKTKDEQKH